MRTVDRALALGLTEAEFDLICVKLDRDPNQVELAVFSLMWSEHCAYKHSRKLLRSLPTEGPRVVMGPREDAGAGSGARRSACGRCPRRARASSWGRARTPARCPWAAASPAPSRSSRTTTRAR